ncbi:MAG: hypothetical protein GXX85_06465 [Ignavibacteria bacterium]|nr:hypothetical protein [Ignavibacteria bacterium]
MERGYAGFSLWDWHRLPDYTDSRYKEYARGMVSSWWRNAALHLPPINVTLNGDGFIMVEKCLCTIFPNIFKKANT